jgi:5'-3' exonuclease, N-terminal resolvase-like domain
MNKFLLVDASHMFHRAKHSVRGDQNEKIGMCLHILLNILSKAWRSHSATHVVFCFDGRSWRKDVYKPYKANRVDLSASPAEIAENKLFFEAFDIFREFVRTKTNCTVLENPILEADDLISGFIKSHPDDTHVIVSSDGDFEQLLAPNVILYNGVADTTTTMTGIFDYKGKPIVDKLGNFKPLPEPEYSLFEKCIRGCTTDNIFSAYPGIREKGSKNKVGLREAFEDREKKGFNWSSVMMHRWSDHHGVEHKVLDDYNRNRQLVDLCAQPDDIQIAIYETIGNASTPKSVPQIGLHFLKFCGKHELVKISERATEYVTLLSSKYPLNGTSN